ncbi:helix-turn-helix domain-containing protein [bacterium]|nr:helix-turn-helix domain-containing protein [bacterium]
MLNHEWMRQRDRRIRHAPRDTDTAAEAEDAQLPMMTEADTALEEVPEEQRVDSSEATLATPEAQEVAAPEQEQSEEPAPAPEVDEEPAADEAAEPALLAEPTTPHDSTVAATNTPDPREVADRIEVPIISLRQRLESVLARQAQLPLDIEARHAVSEGVEGSPRETREALVQRLLDPTLTLEEVAVLLGVCRTTIRRYTDRGVLRCYRTPGNQRRFHLSDVLDFMEVQNRPR